MNPNTTQSVGVVSHHGVKDASFARSAAPSAWVRRDRYRDFSDRECAVASTVMFFPGLHQFAIKLVR